LPDVGHATVTRTPHHEETPMKLSKVVRVDEAESNKCPEPGCNKTFSRRADLNKHTKDHTRPYKCSVPTCRLQERGFAQMKELNRHIASHHHTDSSSSLKCPHAFCSTRATRTDNLIRHLVSAHGMSREASRTAIWPQYTDGDNNQAPSRELSPPLNSSIHEKSILALQSLDIVPADDDPAAVPPIVIAAPTDSGYGSLGIVDKSQASAYAHSESAQTVYSVVQSVSEDDARMYTQQFAETLTDFITSEAGRRGDDDSQLVEVLAHKLPFLIKAFALRLGCIGSSKTERDVMVFIHKNRRWAEIPGVGDCMPGRKLTVFF
jgi:hypothetical protein